MLSRLPNTFKLTKDWRTIMLKSDFGTEKDKKINILALSGSARSDSSNTALLQALKHLAPNHIEINVSNRVTDFPIFVPNANSMPNFVNEPEAVTEFRNNMNKADLVLIA